MSTNREVVAIIREYEAHGWSFRLSKKGHWIGTGPNGERATLPGTPGAGRSLDNNRADLRRWLRSQVGPVPTESGLGLCDRTDQS